MNGVVHNTFKEACVGRGLIAANQFWIHLTREAVASQMPRQTHRGLGRDAAYLRGLGNILSVFRYNGYNLQAFNLPHQGVIVNGNMVDQIEAIFGKLCSLFQEVITWVSPAIVSKVQTFGMCANNITYSKT